MRLRVEKQRPGGRRIHYDTVRQVSVWRASTRTRQGRHAGLWAQACAVLGVPRGGPMPQFPHLQDGAEPTVSTSGVYRPVEDQDAMDTFTK